MNGHAKALVIARNRFSDKVVALVFGVALEGFLVFQVLAALLHRLNNDRSKRKGDVADTELNNFFFGMSGGKFVRLARHVGKQIIGY